MADPDRKARNHIVADLGGLVVIAGLTGEASETLFGLALHIGPLLDNADYAARCKAAGVAVMTTPAGRPGKVAPATLMSCGAQLKAARLDAKPRDAVLGALLDGKDGLRDPAFRDYCKRLGLDERARRKGGEA